MNSLPLAGSGHRYRTAGDQACAFRWRTAPGVRGSLVAVDITGLYRNDHAMICVIVHRERRFRPNPYQPVIKENIVPAAGRVRTGLR
jgi:hypothetical protein